MVANQVAGATPLPPRAAETVRAAGLALLGAGALAPTKQLVIRGHISMSVTANRSQQMKEYDHD
jgi:hypothetical protein